MLQGVCHVSDGFLGSGHAPSNNSSVIGTSHALPSAYCRDHAVYDLYHSSVTPPLHDHGEKYTVPSIEPTTLDPAIRKTALRLFTYGLYAVGVARGDERNMFTANWLTQVSFEPPLIAVSVENDGHSIDLMRESGVFSVSVFSDQQREQAGVLGKRWKLRPDKIESVSTRAGLTGCPILADSLGFVECRVIDSM